MSLYCGNKLITMGRNCTCKSPNISQCFIITCQKKKNTSWQYLSLKMPSDLNLITNLEFNSIILHKHLMIKSKKHTTFKSISVFVPQPERTRIKHYGLQNKNIQQPDTERRKVHIRHWTIYKRWHFCLKKHSQKDAQCALNVVKTHLSVIT